MSAVKKEKGRGAHGAQARLFEVRSARKKNENGEAVTKRKGNAEREMTVTAEFACVKI